MASVEWTGFRRNDIAIKIHTKATHLISKSRKMLNHDSQVCGTTTEGQVLFNFPPKNHTATWKYSHTIFLRQEMCRRTCRGLSPTTSKR